MTFIEWIAVVMIAVILGSLALFVNDGCKREQACEARSGVLVGTFSGRVCIKAERIR